MDRRRFLELSVGSGLIASTSRVFGSTELFADTADSSATRSYTIPDRMAAGPAFDYRPYSSKPLNTAEAVAWIQVDLGARHSLDAIRLYPAAGVEGEDWPYPYNFGTFPLRYKLETSDHPDFTDARLIADCTGSDYPDPKNQISEFPAKGKTGRVVRLTVTRMRQIPKHETFAFSISKMSVLSAGTDIAEHCPAAADTTSGNPDDLPQITRAARPQGEGIITDHPHNVTTATTWKAVQYQAHAPRNGVTLDGGLFQSTLENNIGYLLDSYSVDELLRQFRERAGKPNPPGMRKPDKFWEEDLAGSNAGRFLMGAGNTLRWIDHRELRTRLNAVVDGIDECKQPNGYIMAYPEDTIFYSERGAYTRAWLTHGLIEAGYCGNPKAFGLLRGYYDWFNQCPYLPKLLRSSGFGPQGMIANTRLYSTPVGKPADLQVIQRYFQENYWLEDLASRKEKAVWQYPYDRPHCYEVTFFEAYLDLYLGTGDKRYLDAMLGAWEMYHDKWEHVGGSASLEEFAKDPPRSYRLDHNHGEFCGTTFWAFFNQRFQLMHPDQEKYLAEIEKSIYNIAIANQAGTEGIRYFAVLLGPKQKPTRNNTCCEGQGTRLLGSLPEHIYSLASDGVYVNLFEPSTLSWKGDKGALRLKMETRFPVDPSVKMKVSVSAPVSATIRVRVPSWAQHDMEVTVNSKRVSSGKPGTYVNLDHTWSDGDEIAFVLPIAFKLTRYEGVDQIAGHSRYALEYGPFLLAAVGSPDAILKVKNGSSHEEFLRQLVPTSGQDLHFKVAENENVEYMPYWQVKDQQFTCFPVIDLETT